jgi:hypothetical protein
MDTEPQADPSSYPGIESSQALSETPATIALGAILERHTAYVTVPRVWTVMARRRILEGPVLVPSVVREDPTTVQVYEVTVMAKPMRLSPSFLAVIVTLETPRDLA